MTPKTKYDAVPGRGWAVVNAKRHAERKINPTRRELALRDAMRSAGLEIDCNVEVQTSDGRIINFLAVTELRGKPCYVWFADPKAWVDSCPFNKEARRRKVDHVMETDCYALELYDGPADHLWAQVEQWTMTLSSIPKRLAPRRRPGRPKTINHDKTFRRPGKR